MQDRPMSSSFDPSATTITFSGTVDELQVGNFRQRIADAFTDLGDNTLTIDLSDVDYFPSVAVSALIQATRRSSRAGSSEVVTVSGSITERVLVLTGLPHRLR